MTKEEFMRQRQGKGLGQGSSVERSSSVAASAVGGNRMTKEMFSRMRQQGQRPWTSTPEEAKQRWAGESHQVTLSQADEKQQVADQLRGVLDAVAAREELAELQKQREDYDRAVEEALGNGLDADSWYSVASLKAGLAGMQSDETTKDDLLARVNRFIAAGNPNSLDVGAQTMAQERTDETAKAAEDSAKAYEEAQRQLAYARAYRFSTMPEREDFEELSAKGLADLEERRAAASEATLRAASGAGLSEGGVVGDTLSRIGTAPTGGMPSMGNQIMAMRESAPLDELPTDEWSEEQRKIYGYLRALDAESGKNEASEYGRQINDSLAKSKKEDQLRKITDVNGWGLAGESIGARVAGLASGADYFNKLLEYNAKGYTTVDPYVTFTDFSEAVDSEAANRINKWSGTLDESIPIIGGKGVGDVYQLGTSVIDSIVTANLGGEWGSLAIFFGKAASSGYNDALKRGADPGQALAYGFAQGTAEAFFEKFSVENLLDADKAAMRSFVQNLLVQGGVEASEEFATSIANTLNDVLILKEKGELESAIREAMGEGLSYEEAAKKVMLETFESWTYDALGGFASGAGSMAIQSAGRRIAYNQADYKGDARGLIEDARALDDKQAAAVADRMEKRLDKRGKDGKEGTLTNAEAGKLGRSIEKGMDNADRTARVEAVKARLQELGSGEMSARLAETIVKAQEKKTLTKAETDMLRNSDYAKQVLREFSGFGVRQGQEHAVRLGGSEARPVRAVMPGRGNNSADWARNIGQYRYQPESFGQRSLTRNDKTEANTKEEAKQRPVQVPERLPIQKTVSQEEREQLLAGASLFGEDAKTVTAAYHGGQNVDSYLAAMNAAINMFAAEGANRATLDKMKTTAYLSADQKDAAWQRGHAKYLQKVQQAEAQSRKGAEREIVDITPGRVSYEGITLKGVKYKAADPKTFSKAQKRQAEASAALAKACGLEIAFFDGQRDGGTQGVYRSGGKIWLNANAGAAIGRTLIISTFSHELTHFAEEYGGKAYRDLRDYVVKTLADGDAERFEQIVHEKMKEQSLTYEDALSEVVADGCEMMLRDTNAPALLARENPSLLQRICDWIGELTEKLRAAFEDVDARHEEARILMKEGLELQKRWDAALAEAVQNREAARSDNENARSDNEKAAPEGGKEQYSSWGDNSETITVGSTDEERYEILKNKKVRLAEANANLLDTFFVERLVSLDKLKESGEIRGKELSTLQDIMRKLATKLKINSIDFKNSSISFPFRYSNRNVSKSANHQKQYSGSFSDLAKALSCIKDLVDGAQLIETHKEKKTGTTKENRDLKQTYILLGAMREGVRVIPVEMVVKEFYTSNAGLYMTVTLSNNKDSEVIGKASAGKAAATQSLFPKSEISIQDLVRDVKAADSRLLKYFPDLMLSDEQQELKKHALVRQERDYDAMRVKTEIENTVQTQTWSDEEQHSEWDGGVSDRELLREAAEREDASEAVKKYARKLENLEAYQRRLERQQKRLNEETMSGEEREALSGRIADTQALIEKTNKALIAMELRSDMRKEADAARERWWSTNVGDAVETSRNLQRENRELKQAVDYYRAQAKLTTSENRTVNPADVKRFAKALIKEHGSSVDAGKLAEALQELGDMLVSNDEGRGLSDREIRQKARAAARALIDEVYEENRDAEELRREIAGAVRSARLQISDELRGDITDFNQWRKAHMGRFTLVNQGGTPIDSFYKEMAATYGEGMFPQDITAQADMLERIDNLIDGLRGQRTYAYSRYEREEIVGLVAEEILDTMLSGEIREAETMADRNFKAMQQRMLEAREAQRKAEQEAERAGRRADRAEETALRRAREEQKAITREKVKNLRKELNESREAQQTRINIERMRSRLSKLLRENSKNKHLPEILREDIGKFLLSLDTLGPFSAGTKSEARFQEELREIEYSLSRIKDSGELEKVYGDLDLSEGVKAMLQNNIDNVRAAIGEGGEKVTRRMGLKELQALEEALTVISTAVSNMNELLTDGEHRFAHMDELGESTIKENLDIAEDKTVKGWVSKQLKWANLTPYYAFKRFGEAGQEIFRGLTRGWGKMARHVDQIQRYAEEVYTSEEVRSWEKKEHSFKLVPRMTAENADEFESAVKTGGDLRQNEKTVTMTEAQIMSLYCLNKREQARGHLYGAGIRIGDYKIGRKETTQAEHYLVTPEDMAKMTEVLSERQIEVCDALVKYMNTVGSSWGNEVSMKLYGIRLFTEENYFPIRSDSTQHNAKTKESDRGNLFRLANQSFTKMTVKNAEDAIIIDSVFDVFANHMADMAKYNALVLPMLDTMRWYNYQAENTSVQQSLQRAFGSEAGRYFMDFMQDMNGAGEGGRGEEGFSRAMSGVKVASVGANIRVALQQPTSIARASLVIDPKYLARGAAIKGGRDKALKYSGLARWKDLGYFDVNVNRGMREQIKHADGLKEAIQDKSLWLAEKGDQLTWGALWNACELEAKDKTGLSGDELMQKTAERFDEVILATQVMDSTLTRSDNMRSKSLMLREFTAFMAEPTLTYNMLLDCYSEFDKEKRRSGTHAAVQKVKGQILRTAAVYCLSAALTAIAQAVADAGRDDDDYESWLEKFWQHWTEDFTDNMNPLKLVPIFQDLYTMIVEKKDKELLVLQPIRQAVQVAQIWTEWYQLQTGKIDKATKTTWYGNMTMYGQIYKTLQVFSSATGLPLGAASREFQAGYNTFLRPMLNETYGKFSGKELGKWRTYDGGAKSQIKNAWENKYLTDEEAIALLIEEGEAKDETAAKKMIYGWELGGTAAYKAVKDAAARGDTKAYQEAMQAMTDAGYTQKDVQTQVKSAIKQQYQAPESGQKLSKAYCIDYLVKYAGMDRAEATKTAQEWTCFVVTGIQYSELKAAFEDGDIDKWRAIDLLVTYGGKTREAAQKQVENWMK